MKSAAVFLILVAQLLGARGALAEGTIEINHARALAGAVTPADTPDYPVTLSVAGSYLLTSNLTVTQADISAIELTADDIRIDLNGFTIQGPCAQLACSNGSAIGGSGASRVSVRNGQLVEFGSDGLSLGPTAQVTSVISTGHGGHGLSLASGGQVRECAALGNASTGIAMPGGGSVVEHSIAASNGGVGILSGSGGIVRANVVWENGGSGILGQSDSVEVRENAVAKNGLDGIQVQRGSLISDNAVRNNLADGIQAGAASAVQRNSTAFHGFGFDTNLEAQASFRENVIACANGGHDVGANACLGAPCPNPCP